MDWSFPFFETCVAGLELVINPDGSFLWNYVIIKKEKNKVKILKSGSAIPDLKQLISNLDLKFPILFSINGKGIIHKAIDKSEQDNYESLLVKIFPSGKIEDFYIQLFACDDKQCIGSIARRNLIDGILTSLKSEGAKLIACTFGPFAVQSIIPLLDNAGTSLTVSFDQHELLISEGAIKAYTTHKKNDIQNISLKIASLDVPSEEVDSFAAGFAYFNPLHQITSNLTGLNEAKEDYRNELRFKQTGILILGVFFVTLLINFIFFGYLSDQVKSKSSHFLFSNRKLVLADSLAKQIEERTSFLTKSGLSEASRTSFYADQLAQDVPTNITLTNINIEPLIKNDDDKEKIQFEPRKIVVAGKARYALDVNEWIKVMKAKNWISSISLSNYKQKENNDLGEFYLEIKIR